MGTLLEHPIIEYFASIHPEMHVRRHPGTWLNTANPWMLANPDVLLAPASRKPADGVLEVKTSAYSDHWGEPGTDEIPIHYLCQVYWYLRTLGLRWAIVAVLIGGNDYREYVVRIDHAAADELMTIGRQFMDSLDAGIPPDLDGGTATMQTIKTLHPDIDGTSVDVPDSIGWRLVHEKSRLVVPTERFDAAKAELADFMGNAKTAYWDGRKIADRRSKNGGTPYIQLASNLPVPTRVPGLTERDRVSV